MTDDLRAAIPCNPDDGLIPVLCSTCDPPGVVYVQPGMEIPDPYICTVCQKRAMRRMDNATDPWAGRMQHGAVRVKGD
jgi:hypothetical protein